MTEAIADDLGLRIPLQGVQLIEASAGTGKTFTVATVYSRLVIEQRLPVPRLLAVTYTVAATKELREALRGRLVLALDMLAGEGGEGTPPESEGQAAALTRAMLARALQDEPRALVLARLQRAVQEMDLAPIHTIHGFCQRALHEHALFAGQPLDARELVMNEAGLRHEVALAFWRRHSRGARDAEALLALWGSPESLASSLRELMTLEALLPAPAPGAADEAVDAALEQARLALAAAFLAHGEQARQALRQACADKEVNAKYSKDEAVDPVWAALARWAAQPVGHDPDHKNVGWYSSASLQQKANARNVRGQPGQAPASPLFEAIGAWVAARAAADAGLAARKLALVHEARAFALARLRAIKRERGLLGFDDMIAEVHAALEGPQGEAFAQALQAQYAMALVDEFQDTDARQWAIFRRLFAEPAPRDGPTPRALFLIGDPKQAIYGFRGGDVATYLVAQSQARQRHPLARNFRSRPRVLEAVQALFELAGPQAFRQPGIGFEPVLPGGACEDGFFRVDGQDQPGLLLQTLEDDGDGVDALREQATRACVASIHALLQQGQAGRARLVDRERRERAVQPGDISVLVATHAQGLMVQQALAALGIPSVAAGRQSLYATEEARHLCWWLEALMSPADDARLRAALAAPLFGLDGAAIAGFDTDLAGHRAWQDRMLHWAQRARRHGPMAALGEICAAQAPRLLAWPDGERRLSNYLQLAEELQAADAVALGLPGLLAELERRIEDADENNDEELLRLESDAARVRIMTVHVSKGLTLDLVFAPFTATTLPEPRARSPRMAVTRDEGLARIGHLFPEKASAASQAERAELEAEHIRLLYVALTRARLATWVSWGEFKRAAGSAIGLLLDGHGAQALADAAPGAIAVLAPVADDATSRLPRLQFQDLAPPPAPPPPTRMLDRDWWVYSFSQLAREASGLEQRGADDEFETPLPRSRFSGARFGNALHDALEHVDFGAWREFRGELPPAGELDALQQALRRAGYSSEEDQVEGVRLLCDLVGETVNAPMPEGTRLAWLPAAARLSEMEFHLAMAPVQVEAMLDLLHAHGLVAERRGFGARRRLEGLLTGRIDLVYVHADRYYVLDYKSNQLPGYGPEEVERAIAQGEYDLQYLIYTLALHRWLRFRLGADYDPDAHLGGVRYLFCRGLDRDDPARPGLHALRLPTDLVRALDALFGQPAQAGA